MAGEVSTRQWWLVVRRDGHVVRRLKLNLNLVLEGNDLDPLVGQVPTNRDVDLVDDATIFPAEEQGLFASYELVATSSPFEINEVE